ncbi:type VI secretion system protein TssA [Corallococcus exiguus]|uniref:type VI secretion system protein TssA n=1 Tax=Corallococcus exiguus TaxID=83462 RepID=UPI00156082DA|nr:type VI secretion system protein TssA [Corallococcus exiguus]NRD46178.1 type VI secretion system protein TssA [Corallococcus exiguus]
MAVTIEQLKERAKEWIEPVPGQTPAGKAAKADPTYAAVLAEMAKLESVTGGAIDWSLVLGSSGQLLQSTTKDLRIATYMAYGLYQTQGLEGLATGLVVVSEIMERYWPALFPELARIRGRANVVGWLVERCSSLLPSLEVSASDRERVEALDVATRRLAEVSRQKFDTQGPAIRPLLESVQRLQASLPAAAPPPPPKPAAQVAPKPVLATNVPPSAALAPLVPPVAPAVAAAPAPMPAVGSLASADGAVDFLRQTGSALASAAGLVRRASPAEVLPYRLLRVGLYLHLSQPPPADVSGKTTLPAPPANLRANLGRMAANARWADLLEESESALIQHRFCLDLHFLSARALAELGFRPARQALVAELGSWLTRMPTVPGLLFGDGTPVAGTETRAWLDSELAPPAQAVAVATSSSNKDVTGGDGAEVLAEARKLLSGGNAAGAMGLLQERVGAAGTGRERFKARLALAKLCAAAGQPNVARALYEALDRESKERGLDEWDPALAAECLEGWFAVSRPPPKSPEALVSDFTARYHRLCLLDPGAALKVSL